MAKSFQGEAIQPPVPFNSALTSIKPSCRILQNGGVILPQLSCHILENVNERVCKIKFMGCQWRIRTRRAITYLLSSRSLWYVKQKSKQLNAGISIVLHFTADVGQCLFSPSLFSSCLFFLFLPFFCGWLSPIMYKANDSIKRASIFHKLVVFCFLPLSVALILHFLFEVLFYSVLMTSCIIHLQIPDFECLYFTTHTMQKQFEAPCTIYI